MTGLRLVELFVKGLGAILTVGGSSLNQRAANARTHGRTPAERTRERAALNSGVEFDASSSGTAGRDGQRRGSAIAADLAAALRSTLTPAQHTTTTASTPTTAAALAMPRRAAAAIGLACCCAAASAAASPAAAFAPAPAGRRGTALQHGGGGFGKPSAKPPPPPKKRKGKPAAAAASRDPLADTFAYTGAARPLKRSPTRAVPEGIMRPDYWEDGIPKKTGARLPWVIETKSPEAIEAMRKSGRIAREVLDAAGRAVKVGMTTDDIDAIVHAETTLRGAYPSPLNYNGFPKSCCTSVNEVICHGIPDASVLKDGDLVNIDITCYFNGYHGDCSEMFYVGDVDEKGRDLVKVTYDCWQEALNFCKPGRAYKDIGAIIEE